MWKDFCFKCIPLCVLSILLLLPVLHYNNERQTIMLHATFECWQPFAIFLIIALVTSHVELFLSCDRFDVSCWLQGRMFYRHPWLFLAPPSPWGVSPGTVAPSPGAAGRYGWSGKFSLGSKSRTRSMSATTPAQPCASIVRSYYEACLGRECSAKVFHGWRLSAKTEENH